ncbi:MAG: SDR family oxidoreductase [Alphaproteobacteria bacterium]|nr:MAG: SDR family oxidoreductase [Alphaproteobacteria bacterium]
MANSQPQRAAIVTGGASGIGLATVERLIAAGWRVTALDRDAAALAKLRAAHGDTVRTGVLDVTDEAAADAAVKESAQAFGRIDGLVNSAGIGLDKPALDTSVAEFRTVLDVNVTGTFIVARAAARIMRQQKRTLQDSCAIVNLASIAGMRGSKGRVAYGASKGAVINLTQVMAVDLARDGIRVNAVAPGPVDTPLVQAVHTPAVRRAYAHHTPMRRYAAPDEVAAAILFLLDSAQSSYVTGTILPVDGGFSGAGMMEIEV